MRWQTTLKHQKEQSRFTWSVCLPSNTKAKGQLSSSGYLPSRDYSGKLDCKVSEAVEQPVIRSRGLAICVRGCSEVKLWAWGVVQVVTGILKAPRVTLGLRVKEIINTWGKMTWHKDGKKKMSNCSPDLSLSSGLKVYKTNRASESPLATHVLWP